MGMLSGSQCGLPPPSDLVLSVPVTTLVSGLSEQKIELMAVTTSADGRYIAYARSGSVAVLSATGHPVATLPTGATPTGLSFVGNSDRLLIMTARDIYLWSPGSGHRPLVVRPASQPDDVAVSGSGTVLAAAEPVQKNEKNGKMTNGQVEVWSAQNGHHLQTVHPVQTEADSQGFYSTMPVPLRVALSPSGDVVASGDADGTVFLWQVSTRKRLAVRTVSVYPIVELSPAADGSPIIAADWPQVGSGVNGAGYADVLNPETGQVMASYRAPAPLVAPIDPAAALSADGGFLLAGALGLAPTAPGGVEAAYQVAGGQLMAALRTGAQPAAVSYSGLAPWPWSPDGTRVLAGESVYACDACGDLAELRAVAASRAAWDRPLSAADDHPPATDPYR
jgi:WD40 repeat protein